MDISGRSGTTTEPEWIKTACVPEEPLDERLCNQVRNPGVWLQVRRTSLQLRNSKGKAVEVKWVAPCIVCQSRESSAGMASSPCGNSNFDSGLEIKTRSVEQTLIPLVSQVSARLTQNNAFYCISWTCRTFKPHFGFTTAAMLGLLTLTSIVLFTCMLTSRAAFKACPTCGEFTELLHYNCCHIVVISNSNTLQPATKSTCYKLHTVWRTQIIKTFNMRGIHSDIRCAPWAPNTDFLVVR